ncbi:MAG: hypothetical protein WAL99_01385 [Pseudonocardiaceae bacterium]
MKSREQQARSQFDTLAAEDKLLVLDWIALGNTWEDSVTNSGVLTAPRPSIGRLTPDKAARQAEYERQLGKLVKQRLKRLMPDEVSRRRETAEHEAAHGVIVLSFGLALHSISIDVNDPRGGLCQYSKGATPFQNAVIAIAPVVWLDHIRDRDFPYSLPRGATGCESDLIRARDNARWELDRAVRQAREILTENYDSVMAVADKLDRDGEYRP